MERNFDFWLNLSRFEVEVAVPGFEQSFLTELVCVGGMKVTFWRWRWFRWFRWLWWRWRFLYPSENENLSTRHRWLRTQSHNQTKPIQTKNLDRRLDLSDGIGVPKEHPNQSWSLRARLTFFWWRMGSFRSF